jgi:hypothetical protein
MDIVSLLNTTGAIYGAGTTYHSGAPPVLSGVRVARSLVFYLLCCISLFDTFSMAIVFLSIYGFWLPLWYLQTFLVQASQIEDHQDQL